LPEESNPSRKASEGVKKSISEAKARKKPSKSPGKPRGVFENGARFGIFHTFSVVAGFPTTDEQR
jgi:hypothetical protein